MTIRIGNSSDLAELQQLFEDTITVICKPDYTNKQIDAWISGIENKQRWENVLKEQFVLIAQDNEKIIGFCTLYKGKYIDFLYVNKDYQRQGIANKLYAEIEKEAKRQGQTRLTSNVSKTAQAFFQSAGFKIIKEQKVVRNCVGLTNYKMRKKLIGS